MEGSRRRKGKNQGEIRVGEESSETTDSEKNKWRVLEERGRGGLRIMG